MVKMTNLVASNLDSSTVYYGAMKKEIEVFLQTMGDRHGTLEGVVPNYVAKGGSQSASRASSSGLKGEKRCA